MAGSCSLLLQRLNFKPQDLYAISRIGQDSKLYKPYSIGRFGLGFYCVYHFTDIPGFVSGENIVIFDPHAFVDLPGISPSQPYEEDIFLNNISFHSIDSNLHNNISLIHKESLFKLFNIPVNGGVFVQVFERQGLF